MSLLRVIVDGPRDPQMNMAIDEALARLRHQVGYDTLRLYMWLPSGVSLGRGQEVLRAVNMEAINRLGFKLVRRPTGGAALLHPQDGEVTYSIVLPSSHELYTLDVTSSAARIAGGVALAVKRLGLEAGVRGLGEPGSSNYCYVNPGSSDVLVGGRKVSGSAQRRSWGALLQHGTLLLSYDPIVSTSVINVESSENIKPGGSVTGLRDILGDIPLSSIIEALSEGFREALGYREFFRSSLSPEELSLALELYKVKYSRDEWNLRGAVEEKWK